MIGQIFLVTIAIGLCGATFCSLPSLLSCLHKPLIWEGGSLSLSSESAKDVCASGHYVTENMIASKAVYKYDTVIMMMSRHKEGNPASLVYYDTKQMLPEPIFTPYPELASHELGNCQAIQNAVDMYLDHTGLLWVLDSGIVNTLTKPKVTCPPKVVCICTNTGKFKKSLDLSSLAIKSSTLQHIIVDYKEDKVFLYISDAPCGAILVYDVCHSRGFRVLLPKVVAPSIKPNDDLYMALVHQPCGNTVLYITYLHSPCIFSIKTQYLTKGKTQGKITHIGAKVAPMIFIGTDGQSSIFFRYNNQGEIFNWNTLKPFDPESLKPIYKSEDCFLPTSVIVDSWKGLKVLESTLKDYIDNTCGCGTIQQLKDLPKL